MPPDLQDFQDEMERRLTAEIAMWRRRHRLVTLVLRIFVALFVAAATVLAFWTQTMTSVFAAGFGLGVLTTTWIGGERS